MSCPSCITALSGYESMAGPLDPITDKVGSTGTMVAFGALGALLGSLISPSKTLGAVLGGGVGVGAAWLLSGEDPEQPIDVDTQDSEPIVEESPPALNVPAPAPVPQALPKSVKVPKTKLKPPTVPKPAPAFVWKPAPVVAPKPAPVVAPVRRPVVAPKPVPVVVPVRRPVVAPKPEPVVAPIPVVKRLVPQITPQPARLIPQIVSKPEPVVAPIPVVKRLVPQITPQPVTVSVTLPPCRSIPIIKRVQASIDNPTTGLWTFTDQVKLNRAGLKYHGQAGGCSGAVPSPVNPPRPVAPPLTVAPAPAPVVAPTPIRIRRLPTIAPTVNEPVAIAPRVRLIR